MVHMTQNMIFLSKMELVKKRVVKILKKSQMLDRGLDGSSLALVFIRGDLFCFAKGPCGKTSSHQYFAVCVSGGESVV